MNACLSVWGVTALLMPARRATLRTTRAGAVPVQPPSVRSQEYRPVSSFPDGQVDRPGGARRQRDRDDLAALTGDRQCPVPTFQAQVLDVGAGRLGDPQPVQGEQGDQRMLSAEPSPAATSRAPSSLRSSAVAWDS